MRNVGGSIGISIATTMLTRRADVHQNEILSSSPGGVFGQGGIGNGGTFLQGTQQALTGYYGHANVTAPAQLSLYQQLQRQASSWAFVDVFRWLSLLCFFCVIIVWFFKKVKPGKAPAGAH